MLLFLISTSSCSSEKSYITVPIMNYSMSFLKKIILNWVKHGSNIFTIKDNNLQIKENNLGCKLYLFRYLETKVKIYKVFATVS